MRATKAMTRSILLSSLVFLIGLTFGCGGPSSQSGQAPSGSSAEIPELTDELIHERINDAWLREVPPEENTNAEPISWRFDRDEPREIVILEKQIEGTKATIVLDIKTTSAPRSSNKRYLAGQIRTEWALKTGWVLRRWEIVDTENISMKYKNLPKPSDDQNANRE